MLRCCLPNLRSASGRNVLLPTHTPWLRTGHTSSLRDTQAGTDTLLSPAGDFGSFESVYHHSILSLDSVSASDQHQDQKVQSALRSNGPSTCSRGSPSQNVPRERIKEGSLPRSTSICNITSNSLASRVDQSVVPPPLTPGESAERALTSFLSLDNLSSAVPTGMAFDKLRHLYTALVFGPQLRAFAALNSTTLLDLLGSLLTNAKHPFRREIFVDRVRSLIDIRTARKDEIAHFVVQVATDKIRCGGGLKISERYWLLRACLVLLQQPFGSSNTANEVYAEYLRQARLQYSFLQKRFWHPAIHAPYLATLLDLARSDLFDSSERGRCWEEVVSHLSSLLRSQKHVHFSSRELLWEVVLNPVQELTRQQEEYLLDALRSRVLEKQAEQDSPSAQNFTVIDVRGLVDLITGTVFSTPPVSPSIRQWALSVSHTCLSRGPVPSPTGIHPSYHNLILLSLSNATPSLLRTHKSPTALPRSSHASSAHYHHLDWRAVCLLATLERQLEPKEGVRTCVPLHPDVTRNVTSVIRKVFREWTSPLSPFPEEQQVENVRGGERSPVEVVMAVMSSLIYLAGKTRDMTFLADCVDHCQRRGLFQSDSGVVVSAHAESLLVEYVVASFSRADVTDWDQVLPSVMRLLAHVPSEVRTSILGQVLMRYTQANETVPLAHLFYSALKQYRGAVISPHVVEELARRLAQADCLDSSLAYALPTEGGLSVEQRLSVLATISDVVAQHERETDSTFVLRSPHAARITQAMNELFLHPSFDPRSWKSHLENSLSAIARAYHSPQVASIATTALRRYPLSKPFFSSTFWTRLFQLLVRHGYLKVALRTLRTLRKTQLYPVNITNQWQLLLYVQFIQRGATKLAPKIGLDHRSVTAGRSGRKLFIRWRVGSQRLLLRGKITEKEVRRKNQTAYTLRLSKLLLDLPTLDVRSCLTVMTALVRTGRLRMAKGLYMKIHERMSAQETLGSSSPDEGKKKTAINTITGRELTVFEVHTLLGNVILHGTFCSARRWRQRRDAQLVRKTRQMLNELMSKYGFVPDRVSVNILFKSILKWEGDVVDVDLIRTLVDRLVRSGYPTFGIVDKGEVPFGTLRSSVLSLSPSPCAVPPANDSDMETLIPQIDQAISWKRHAKPLYRMITEALYLRGDKIGARKMVAILKAGDAWTKARKEMRGRARVCGRTEAKERGTKERKGSRA